MIYLASDHAGFELKEEIKKYLLDLGVEVKDMGAFKMDLDDDYPDFVIPAAQKVAHDLKNNCGIVFGGSGQGEAITANKIKGVRAAVYYGPSCAKATEGKGSLDMVKLSRAHNDANILSLGARFLNVEQAKEAVKLWLETEFEGGRHERRINKIREIEK